MLILALNPNSKNEPIIGGQAVPQQHKVSTPSCRTLVERDRGFFPFSLVMGCVETKEQELSQLFSLCTERQTGKN